MSLQIKDTGAVPDGQWRFLVEATNFEVVAPNWFALYPAVVRHCEANTVQIPTMQAVVDQCCNRLSIGCYDDGTREPLMNRFMQGLPSLAPQASCCNSKK